MRWQDGSADSLHVIGEGLAGALETTLDSLERHGMDLGFVAGLLAGAVNHEPTGC